MKLLCALRDITLGALCGAVVAGIFYYGFLDDDQEIKDGKKVILSGFYPR